MHTQNIEYREGDTLLEGYLAYDEDKAGQLPAVIIGHAWAGRDEFCCKKAEAIAKLGYVGFALDVYGKGVTGNNPEENTELMLPLLQDRALLLRRLNAGLNTVKTIDKVDKNRIAGIGFCFGGLSVLDLARTGADLTGIVSFHAALGAPEGMPDNKIQPKILVLHGHDDPMVPPTQVAEFQNEMKSRAADWQIHIYGNTLHGFTKPSANDTERGIVYNADADRRSWQAMQNFLDEVLSA